MTTVNVTAGIRTQLRNYEAHTSVIGAMGLRRLVTTLAAEGGVEALCFDAHAEQILGPRLRCGDVAAPDKLGAHRSSRIGEVAESRGARVPRPAPYSTDFSPTAQRWSKIKAYLRGAKARIEDELNEALAQAIRLLTKADIRG